MAAQGAGSGAVKLAIIMPTIDGRESSFARALDAYEQTIERAHLAEDLQVKLFAPRNRPTWGIGVNDGIAEMREAGYDPDFLHLSADDLEPLPGWLEVALDTIVAGLNPAPLLDTFGRINYGHPPTDDMSDWKPTMTSVIPFVRWEWWEQYVGRMFPTHFFTDDYVSHMLRLAGINTACRLEYAFKHHESQVKAGAGMGRHDRTHHDMALYGRFLKEGYWPTNEEAVG